MFDNKNENIYENSNETINIEKEEKKEISNVFYTCKKIMIDSSTIKKKYNLFVLKSPPTQPISNTYYITKKKHFWLLTYYTPLGKEIRYYDDDYRPSIVLSSLFIDLENIELGKEVTLTDKFKDKFEVIIQNEKRLNKDYEVGIGGCNSNGNPPIFN